jgi:hypothetical protein
MKTGWLISFMVSCSLTSFAEVNLPDPQVVALEASFAVLNEKAGQPLRDLRVRYRENVEAWMQESQKKGDLQAVVAAQEEIKTMDLEKERNLTQWPELERLRGIYDTATSKISAEVDAERLKLKRPYRERLQQEVGRLTREGKIDEAKRVSAMVTELDRILSPGEAEETGTSDILWAFTNRASVESIKDAEVKTIDKGRRITSKHDDWSYIQSKRTFKPPFRLQTRVSTNKNEIRLYYNADILSMFGWESNPTELRLHEPTTGRKLAFPDKGQVVPGKVHFIEIDVHPDRIEVKVDGELRAQASVSSFGVDAPVGIGPAFGSELTVEMMQVLALKVE